MRRLFTRLITIIAIVGAVSLSATGMADRGLQACGLGYLARTNSGYLDRAFDKSLSGFLVLSSIKSGLAVVEGSAVGVGFNLELGDVVQPVYDYVDIAWKAALTGGSIIVGMQLALKGLGMVDHWFLAGMLTALLLQLLSTWFLPGWAVLRRRLKEAVGFGLSMVLAFYLMLPLSVTAAAVLSDRITRPMVEASQDQLRQIDKEIRPERLNQEVLADMAAGGLAAPSLKTRLIDTAAGIQMLMAFLKTQTEKVAALALRLIAAYIFDCIIFPLFFGLILMTMVKSGVRYFFEIGPRSGPEI